MQWQSLDINIRALNFKNVISTSFELLHRFEGPKNQTSGKLKKKQGVI
jgi:hypothetical protein